MLLLSSFDTFGTYPFNNSEVVARSLVQKLKLDPSFPVDIHFCLLPTVYDEGAEKLSDCFREIQGREVIGVISLGEAFCNIKIETMASNFDNNEGRKLAPDNKGQKRKGVIIKGAPEKLGFTLPLDELYCELTDNEKKNTVISVDAGNFVCNNTAYLFRNNYPDVPFTFMHLPANNCNNLGSLNDVASGVVKKLILKTLSSYEKNLTHSFPTTKSQAKELMRQTNGCYNDFYTQMKKAL